MLSVISLFSYYDFPSTLIILTIYFNINTNAGINWLQVSSLAQPHAKDLLKYLLAKEGVFALRPIALLHLGHNDVFKTLGAQKVL